MGGKPGDHMNPCARIVIALFGSLFLIALLSVPVTTTTSSLRTDPYSRVIIRTTHSRNTRLFLPQYLSMKADPPAGTTIRARTSQWTATIAIVFVLGIFDYLVFCRLLRRTGTSAEVQD
jgi:hypothetical protein